jgi:hypothetical protein
MTKVLAGVEGTSSTMAASEVVKQVELAEEDALRAHMYRLLARFLARPPGERELALAADMGGDGSDLGMAIGAFKNLFENRPVNAHRDAFTDGGQLQSEFQTLPLLAEALADKIAHAALDVW